MSEIEIQAPPSPREERIDHVLEQMADSYGQQVRSPIMHRPSEQGLAYEDITFPALDGVPLEGWYVPAPGSSKLIIVNHPRGFSRSGMPSHLEPWKSVWDASGNGWEINFIPDCKILHDAGYNVLTYDLRNHGHSAAANGGIVSSGLFEYRDVLGSLRYARGRSDTAKMTVGLFSRCLGANSTIIAMARDPAAFDDVRCLLACQPLGPKVIAERLLELAGVPTDRITDLERAMILRTSVGFAERDINEWSKHVRIPTFVYQVRDDLLTRPSDVQATFDNLPVAEKKLHWIDGTTARWDGYAHFQREPTEMLDWLARYMG